MKSRIFSAKIVTSVTFQIIPPLRTTCLKMGMNDIGTHILAGNFVDFVNNFIFEEHNDFNNNKRPLRPMIFF